MVDNNNRYATRETQGGHGTGKTGNLDIIFSRQGKNREIKSNTVKICTTQGKNGSFFYISFGLN